jgi:hypothetical protein
MKLRKKSTRRFLAVAAFAVAVSTGTSQAIVYTANDAPAGAGNTFQAAGVAIDIDSSYSSLLYDSLPVSGQVYRVVSVSLYIAPIPGETGNRYLSVFDYTFTGFGVDTSGSHLGHSDNAIDVGAATSGELVTWTFNNSMILVTADSAGWNTGTGMLYFTGDTDQNRNNNGAQGINYFRIDGDQSPVLYGSSVYNNGVLSARVPELIVTLVAIPEPSVALLSGLGVFALLHRRRA